MRSTPAISGSAQIDVTRTRRKRRSAEVGHCSSFVVLVSGCCGTKSTTIRLSVTSPVAEIRKFDVSTPRAPARIPSPASTPHCALPWRTPLSGEAPTCPGAIERKCTAACVSERDRSGLVEPLAAGHRELGQQDCALVADRVQLEDAGADAREPSVEVERVRDALHSRPPFVGRPERRARR